MSSHVFYAARRRFVTNLVDLGSAGPAGVQLTHLPDLLRIRALLVDARHLQVHREVLERRVGEEGAETLAHHPFEDIRVAVEVRSERGGAVVDMERPYAVDAEVVVDLLDERLDGLGVGDVVAGGKEMARVEADAEPRVRVEPVDEYRELVDRPPDRRTRARRVLHQEPRVAGAAL